MDQAAAVSPAIGKVNPIGEVFNCAFALCMADPDPYGSTSVGKIDL